MNDTRDIVIAWTLIILGFLGLFIVICTPIILVENYNESVLCEQANKELEPHLHGSIFERKCYITLNGLPYQYSKLHHMQIKGQ